MSTDLYGIRVLEIQEAKLKLQVFLVYYDWNDLPRNRTFFLRALWGPYYAKGPLLEAITVNQICDESFVDKNARSYIRSLRRTSTKNHPIDRSKGYATFYYERDGKWQDEDKLVQGTYELELTDPRWAEHLSVGMAWGTTAYETEEAPHILGVEEAGALDLSGATVVLTGKLKMPRADAKKALEGMGAKVGSAIGEGTRYLIVGEKPGSKLREATQRDIPILAEAVLAAAIARAGAAAEVDHAAEKAARSAAQEQKRAKKKARAAAVPAPVRGAELRELPRAKTEDERALIFAVARRDGRRLGALLAAGQSPNIANETGVPLLGLALSQRVSKKDNPARFAVIKALLEAGADPNVVQPKAQKPSQQHEHSAIPLFFALTDYSSQRLLKPLLEAGASLAVVDPASGRSVLHIAAEEQNDALIGEALKAGAPLEARDRQGNTALHALVASPSWRPLKGAALSALLEAGLELDAPNAAGETAAHLAARHRNAATLTALKKAGADLNARAEGGATTLHYAAMGKRDSSTSKVEEIDTLKWLLRHTDHDLEVTDEAGETLLHAAARSGSDRMVKHLLAEGLSADRKNKAGETPRAVCKRKKSLELLEAAEGRDASR